MAGCLAESGESQARWNLALLPDEPARGRDSWPIRNGGVSVAAEPRQPIAPAVRPEYGT